MSLSLAVLINDRRLLPCVCHHLGGELESIRRASVGRGSLDATDGEDGLADATVGDLGMGYFDQGEVLLSRRPIQRDSSLEEMLCRPLSGCLIAHAATGRSGTFRPSGTQPFRFRDWLWAQSGDLTEVSGFDRDTLALPSYIRSNIRTWRPEEVAFHLYLSFLHRTGTLETLRWDRHETRTALASAVSLVDTYFAGSGGGESPSYSILVTNGDVVFGVGVRRPLALRRVEGIEYCTLCADNKNSSPSARQSPGHPHLRATILTDVVPEQSVFPGTSDETSAGQSGWELVPAGNVVEIDAGMGVEQGPLLP